MGGVGKGSALFFEDNVSHRFSFWEKWGRAQPVNLWIYDPPLGELGGIRDVSHYLNSRINQFVLSGSGESFASSDGITDARDRHPQFPGNLGLGQAQLADTPVAK